MNLPSRKANNHIDIDNGKTLKLKKNTSKDVWARKTICKRSKPIKWYNNFAFQIIQKIVYVLLNWAIVRHRRMIRAAGRPFWLALAWQHWYDDGIRSGWVRSIISNGFLRARACRGSSESTAIGAKYWWRCFTVMANEQIRILRFVCLLWGILSMICQCYRMDYRSWMEISRSIFISSSELCTLWHFWGLSGSFFSVSFVLTRSLSFYRVFSRSLLFSLVL